MFNKIVYIILLFSSLYSQSYFNRVFGADIQYGDARSMALANTYATTGTSSSVISRNPARLSYLSNGNKGYSFDFQINSRIYFERRSIDILDSFGDFLTETDYVSNQFSNFYGSYGFIASKKTNKGNFGIGASKTTLASFDYRYEEEVRYKKSFDDGESGSRDPLLGFHVYRNKGYLELSSLGFGYSFDNENKSSVAIGFSINKILESSISDYIYIDTSFYSLNAIDYENLSNIKKHEQTYKTPGDSYSTFSIELPLMLYSKQSSIVFSAETEASFNDTDTLYYNLSTLSSLPLFLEYNDLTDQYEFTLEDIQYYKPKKLTFGLRLKKYRTLIVFEAVEEFYSDIVIKVKDSPLVSDSYLNNVSEYKIAFEHKFKMGSDIRMGLSYKQPIINSLLGPISKFTLGSNRKISKKLNADFAISYYITDYNYDDIFPTSDFIHDDCSHHCEKITESNISISATFKWDF